MKRVSCVKGEMSERADDGGATPGGIAASMLTESHWGH